jgi:hypothetical protein
MVDGVGMVDVFPGKPEAVMPGMIFGLEIGQGWAAVHGQGMEKGFAFDWIKIEAPDHVGPIQPGDGSGIVPPVGLNGVLEQGKKQRGDFTQCTETG